MAVLQAVPGPLLRLLKRVRLHRTELYLYTGGEDAAQAGIRAGHTIVAVYGLLPVLRQTFTLKPPKIRIVPNVFSQEDTVWFQTLITVRPIAVLVFGTGLLAGIVKNMARSRYARAEEQSQHTPGQGKKRQVVQNNGQ